MTQPILNNPNVTSCSRNMPDFDDGGVVLCQSMVVVGVVLCQSIVVVGCIFR